MNDLAGYFLTKGSRFEPAFAQATVVARQAIALRDRGLAVTLAQRFNAGSILAPKAQHSSRSLGQHQSTGPIEARLQRLFTRRFEFLGRWPPARMKQRLWR